MRLRLFVTQHSARRCTKLAVAQRVGDGQNQLFVMFRCLDATRECPHTQFHNPRCWGRKAMVVCSAPSVVE